MHITLFQPGFMGIYIVSKLFFFINISVANIRNIIENILDYLKLY